MATIAQLGARTLRKLGVSVVAYSDQPAAAATTTAAAVVSEVLRNQGIYVADNDRPSELPTVNVADLGARTARAVGINPLDLTATASGQTFTRTVIGNKVLLKLAVMASDEPPLTTDFNLAYDKVTATHDSLVALDFVSWGPDAVPGSVVEYYVMIAANMTAAEFGKPASLEVIEQARNAIRAMALSGLRGQLLAEEKIKSVHDALNVQGLIYWPITTVPAAYAEDYVALAAALLAPVMGKAPDKDASVAAEAHIRRAGMVRGASDRALRNVQAVHAELQGNGLVSWTLDAIPGSMVDAYATAATLMMADETGKPFDPAAYSAQMARVRMLAMGGPAGQTLAEQKVRAVHASQDARGRTRWTLFDIPDYIEEPYVFMAATLLAPEVGMKADPAWWVQAEIDLTRIISLPTNYAPVRAVYF